MPPNVAHHLAAAAHWLKAGQPAAAIGPLAEAARLQPGDAGIRHDYGLACLECGLLGEATAALRAAVALKPRFADAHLRLGIALEQSGALDEALAAYRRVTRLEACSADAHYRTAALLESLGRNVPAAQAFQRAAAAAPKTGLGRIAAARAKLAEHRDSEAETMLRQALALAPEDGAAFDLLGNLLAESGRFDEAREMLHQAIARSPQLAGSYYEIVRCRPVREGDAELMARMQAALDTPGLDPVQRSRIHLALGKAADDLGRYQEAMEHFDAAEALRNSACRFDPDAFESLVDRLIATFTPAFLAGVRPARRQDPSPILIVGLPRSGTTLVEQILSAHPQVSAGGELPFWTVWGESWDLERSQTSQPRTSHSGSIAAAASAYTDVLRRVAPRARFVTDKMPLNFLWAGLIHLAFPDATIIHCRRAAIDTALSIHQTHFNPRMPFPTGGIALVSTIRAYQRLCAHWRDVLPADRFVELDYEALVGNPETVIRRCVEACGLVWDQACVYPERNARVVRTPSKWQARQPIYDTAQGRWRRYEPWLGALRDLVEESVLF
jgi:tetratricopeptide (TPR) repeat protein